MAENEKTKGFISWSGKLGHEVSIILRKKLPAIIQSIEVSARRKVYDNGG